MYPARASQVILIHCPSLLRTTVWTFLLSNPPLLPKLLFKTSNYNGSSLPLRNKQTNKRFFSLAFTFWLQATFLTGFPPIPSMPHGFQPNQTWPCSSRHTTSFHNPGSWFTPPHLLGIPFCSCLSLPGKIPLDFQCPSPPQSLHQFSPSPRQS